MADDMTPLDILNIFQGGSAPQRGSDKSRRLIAAILKNPQILNRLRLQAQTQVSPYQQFSTEERYDPTSNYNETLFKYETSFPKAAPAAALFFDFYKQKGATPQAINEARPLLTSELQKYFPADQASSVAGQIVEDAPNYIKAETGRQKRQMAAFYKQREKLGLAPESAGVESDVASFLKERTGVAGLEQVPTSAKEAESMYRKKFYQTLKEKKKSPAEMSALLSAFGGEFKKKTKGKPVGSLVPKDVLAKLLGY